MVCHRGHFFTFLEIFSHLMLTLMHGNYLKMTLEVEYMMEYQHPGLLVVENCWLQRKSADSTVMDRKKAVVSYKPTPVQM